MKIYWYGDSKNIIGKKIKSLRKNKGLTQKSMAAQLQLLGYDFSDLTILRIEQGTRFVPDYEVVILLIFLMFHSMNYYDNENYCCRII